MRPRSGDRREDLAEVSQTLAELDERALLELADALLAHAELFAEVLERAGLVGHEALRDDELLSVAQLPQSVAYGDAGAFAGLARARVVLGRWPHGRETLDHGRVIVLGRLEARLTRLEERQEAPHTVDG